MNKQTISNTEREKYPIIMFPNSIKEVFENKIPYYAYPMAPAKPKILNYSWTAEFTFAGAFVALILFIIALNGEEITWMKTTLLITMIIAACLAIYEIVNNKIKHNKNKCATDMYEESMRQYQSELREKEAIELANDNPSKVHEYRIATIKKRLENAQSKLCQTESVIPSYYQTFLKKLQEFFPDKVFTNCKIDNGKSNNIFCAKFAIALNQPNLNIDIEIDVPYNFSDRQPRNFATTNKYISSFNDDYFLSNKWVVIKFSEEQAINNPIQCCKTIAQTIYDLTNDNSYLTKFNNVDSINQMEQYTFDECKKLAQNWHREKYLLKIEGEESPELKEILNKFKQAKAEQEAKKAILSQNSNSTTEQNSQLPHSVSFADMLPPVESIFKREVVDTLHINTEADSVSTDSFQDDNQENIVLPQIEYNNQENIVLPQIEDNNQENIVLSQQEDNNQENIVLPQIEDNNQENIVMSQIEDNNQENIVIPQLENNNQENIVLPQLEDNNQENIQIDTKKLVELVSKLDYYYKTENWKNLLDTCTNIIELDPKLKLAYMRRSTAYGNLGMFEEAIADCNTVSSLDPLDPDAYYNAAIANLMLKNYQEAIQNFQKAIDNNISNPGDAYLAIAQTYQRLKDFDNTKINLELAIQYGNIQAKILYNKLEDKESKFINEQQITQKHLDTMREGLSDIAFSPDDQYVALSSAGRHLKVYKTSNMQQVFGSDDISCDAIVFSRNGRLIATGSKSSLKIIQIVNGNFNLYTEVTNYTGDIKKMFFHPYNSDLLFVSDNKSLYKVDIKTKVINKALNDFRLLYASPDMQHIVGTDKYNNIKVLLVNGMTEIMRLAIEPNSMIRAAAINNDCTRLYFGDSNSILSVYDIQTLEKIASTNAGSEIIAIEASNDQFAMLANNRKVLLLNSDTTQITSEIQTKYMPRLIRFDNTGETLAVGYYDQGCDFVDIEKKEIDKNTNLSTKTA